MSKSRRRESIVRLQKSRYGHRIGALWQHDVSTLYGFFQAAARRSKRGYRGKLHRCNDAGEAARVLSRDLGGCSFEQDGVDFYIVGADAVRKKLTGNDIYEIAYNEGNGWAGKETIQLDVTNIPDYATLSLDSFKYVALLSSSGTGGATEEITGSYMGVKVLGYDSGSGKLSIQTANAYRPIFIVVIE